MNRNNFFCRFGFFYKQNLKGIKDDAESVLDCLIYYVEDSFFDFIHLLLRVISVFLPVILIVSAMFSEYLDEVSAGREAERLKMRFDGAGYYVNRKIRDKMAERYRVIKSELK
jgi:hypothetical protein